MPIPNKITSARQLAKLLGLSNVAVTRNWLSHSAWTFGPGPWPLKSLPLIKAWGKTHLSPDRSVRSPASESEPELGENLTPANIKAAFAKLPFARRIELGQKLTKQQKDQFQLGVLKEKYHPVFDCDLNMSRAAREVRNALQGLSVRLPNATDEQRKWLDNELERICLGFATGIKSPATSPATPASAPPGPTSPAAPGAGLSN